MESITIHFEKNPRAIIRNKNVEIVINKRYFLNTELTNARDHVKKNIDIPEIVKNNYEKQRRKVLLYVAAQDRKPDDKMKKNALLAINDLDNKFKIDFKKEVALERNRQIAYYLEISASNKLHEFMGALSGDITSILGDCNG